MLDQEQVMSCASFSGKCTNEKLFPSGPLCVMQHARTTKILQWQYRPGPIQPSTAISRFVNESMLPSHHSIHPSYPDLGHNLLGKDSVPFG